MTDSQRFALALTECRSEYNALVATINGLPDTEQPTAEQQGKLTELRSTAAGLETRVAAAHRDGNSAPCRTHRSTP